MHGDKHVANTCGERYLCLCLFDSRWQQSAVLGHNLQIYTERAVSYRDRTYEFYRMSGKKCTQDMLI